MRLNNWSIASADSNQCDANGVAGEACANSVMRSWVGRRNNPALDHSRPRESRGSRPCSRAFGNDATARFPTLCELSSCRGAKKREHSRHIISAFGESRMEGILAPCWRDRRPALGHRGHTGCHWDPARRVVRLHASALIVFRSRRATPDCPGRQRRVVSSSRSRRL